MALDETATYAAPLTKERLFSWHAVLFPTRVAACEAPYHRMLQTEQ